MTDFNLIAKTRTENGKKTRMAGAIPAVVYGKNNDPVSLSVDKLEFLHLYREAGSSNLIDLSIDGDKSYKTLVQDIQRDPVNSGIIHVDLLKVNMKEKIKAEIPIKFIGESRAVIDLEGMLITNRDHIEVECLPADLIPEIEVDITVLDDFEKDIRVSDLRLPAGVEILDDTEEVIIHVEEQRSEEEVQAELESEIVEDVSQVEVESEKKEEEGEATENAGKKD